MVNRVRKEVGEREGKCEISNRGEIGKNNKMNQQNTQIILCYITNNNICYQRKFNTLY